MGRAMIIICAGVLISLGIVSLSTSSQGNLLTEKSAKYANEMTAKNAAHTAVQMAMQNINEDPDWVKNHDSPDEAWVDEIGGATTELYLEPLNDTENNNFWEVDSLRMVSKAEIDSDNSDEPFEATVTSVYLKEPFSTLVPPFGAPLQLPNGYGELNVSGNAHSINGTDEDCGEDGESKPPVTVASESTKEDLDSRDLNMDGEVEVDTTLDYEPTDELIERLENSGNATTVDSDYSEDLGTADDPGVFFIDGNVKLTGQQSEGYGIMVIKNSADMDYEDEDGNTLDIRGNFDWNGLVIFENANAFSGKGTPSINGSVLVGDTEGETDISIDLGGNIDLNYSCEGEDYARMSAADAVEQHKYTRVVTFEETGF